MTIEFDGQNNKLGTTTANSVVIKTNDTDAITIDSSQNVGIGTSSPSGKLHIGGISGSVSGLVLQTPESSGDTNSIDFLNLNGDLRMGIEYDASTADLNIVKRDRTKIVTFDESTGNVGIGTSSPSKPLHVSLATGSGATPTSYSVAVVDGNDNTEFSILGGSSSVLAINFGHSGDADDARITYNTTSGSENMAFVVNASEAMRIDSSGNVGIGTSSPAIPLHVYNTAGEIARLEGNDEFAYLGLRGTVSGSATNLGYLGFGNDTGTAADLNITNLQNGDISFTTNSSERMRIDSTGRVGMGNNTPNARLVLEGDSAYNGKGLRLEMKNSSYSHNLLELEGGRASTNNSFTMIYAKNGNGSGIFQVLDSGNVENTNNSYGSTSDLKLKENIASANSQWEDIKVLPIKKYSLKTEESDSATQIGVIAQDLETAGMSGLVFEKNDRDENGNDLGTTTKSVKYSVLYMKAVKALQEALIEIDNLKARVDTLEGN